MLTKERENVAYHEAGHALVGIFAEHYPNKFYKLTVGVRDDTLGVTFFQEEFEHRLFTRQMFIDTIALKLGGRMAEQIIFGKDGVTSGASNDLEHATKIAEQMVMIYGLGPKQEIISYASLSSPPRDEINEQVKEILNEANQRAKHILTSHKADLEHLAIALLEKETLTYNDVMLLLKLAQTP